MTMRTFFRIIGMAIILYAFLNYLVSKGYKHTTDDDFIMNMSPTPIPGDTIETIIHHQKDTTHASGLWVDPD